MPVATALLRRQRVRRARTSDAGSDGRLVADLLSLATRLAEDAAAGGETAAVFRDAFRAVVLRTVARAGSGVDAAMARLQPWAAGFAAPLLALVDAAGEVRTPADVARAAEQLLDAITERLEALDAASLRPHVQVLFDAVQVDLGLTPTVLEALVWELVEEIAERVRALPPADASVMERRRETVRVLRRLRKRLEGELVIPMPTAAEAAGLLSGWLRSTGAAARAGRAACAGRGVGDAAGAVGRAVQAVPFSFGFQSLGAASAPTEEYAWYASWLLEEDVWVSADRTRVYKNSGEEPGDTLHAGTGLRWFDAPIFHPRPGVFYSFHYFKPEGMETVAYVTAILRHALEMGLHFASLEKGHYALNASNAAASLIEGLVAVIGRVPIPVEAEWGMHVGATFLSSFEGMQTKGSAWNNFKFWLTLVVPDATEMVILRMLPGSLRDAGLSVCTLLNHKTYPGIAGGPEMRAENRRVTAGTVGLVVQLHGRPFGKLYPRKYYQHPFASGEQAAWVFLLWNVAINSVYTFLGYFTGATLAAVLCWDPDWEWMAEESLETWLMSLALFLPGHYSGGEGNTDDGRYNPNGAAFAKYPKAEESPYLLPWTKGRTFYVNQSHQGWWTHNFRDSEGSRVYAVDFALEQDEPVLASRSGTVVEFHDETADDAGGQWNYIVIRHDRDDAGAPLPAAHAHDRGAGNVPVVTFAVYGSGRHHSVRESFAARSIPESNIVGHAVARGEQIMRAGNTGRSFHNHLHMHVHQGELGSPPGSPFFSVADLPDTSFTIPFVFREIKHPVFGTDGVPEVWDFYTSDNEPAT